MSKAVIIPLNQGYLFRSWQVSLLHLFSLAFPSFIVDTLLTYIYLHFYFIDWTCSMLEKLNVHPKLTWLDLILSLFFYCCGCPRYWGRQQVARVSNTQSPRLSVQWIDAAKAAHFHVSLNTFRPGLFRSPSSSGARNCHTCDGVNAWRGACNMSIASQTPSAESCCHLLHS